MLNDRDEAEDVAQETFVRVWNNAATCQQERAKFDTWLHRVALNLCYDRLRARSHYSDEEVPDLMDSAPIAEQRLDHQQQNDHVAAALALLPTRQREALVLQFYQALSNTDSAQLMDVSVEALESLLARARRNLRQVLLAESAV